MTFNATTWINISRTSDCVEHMVVDPIRGCVQVAYAKGNIYHYTHVSRRAILNLLAQPNMSLGFWVNHNLLPYTCKSRIWGECLSTGALKATEMPVAV